MLDLLNKYDEIIKEYHITTFENVATSYRLKLNITFIDKSILYVKEYVFSNDERKYSYHWVSFSGELIYRWDNAPHWNNIKTFPHHKHTLTGTSESRETILEEVLRFINEKMINNQI
jgi:hypothetical protein